jgi:hypothetical protein
MHSFMGLTRLVLAIQPPAGTASASGGAAAAVAAGGGLGAAAGVGGRVGSGLTALPAALSVGGTAAGSLTSLSGLKALKSLELFDTGEVQTNAHGSFPDSLAGELINWFFYR